jgi:hypothetical protein
MHRDQRRRPMVRALNTYHADTYREFRDRLTPAALIPMHSPAEAIAELEHAVHVLGLKAIMIPAGVWRPIPALQRRCPEAYPDAGWFDTYALDSEYDYDPFWAKCVTLKVAVTSHVGVVPGYPWVGRSVTNASYNHVGNHAYMQSQLCKALFLGGVTRRFPNLSFAFLEGGVGWACTLYAGLLGHWDLRGPAGLRDVDPANLDQQLYRDLFARYGGPSWEGKLDQLERRFSTLPLDDTPRDDFATLKVTRREELRDLFVNNFYFVCEADDPINAWAFDTRVNPYGARLKAVFGSDIGHFDVPDMTAVVAEVYEMVERGLFREDDFRDFVFANTVRLHAGRNPEFFEGTVVEGAATKLLAGGGDGKDAS